VRIGVVDIGSNSTRLLVADVAQDGALTELERRSTVTRLGQGVDASGALADEAMARVFSVLTGYGELLDAHGAQARTAVLTSAVRDAANGAAFTARVADEFGLEARTLAGEEEAQLSFLGATSERDPARDAGPIVVIDVGGGSTELVVGRAGQVSFHTSTQAGVVRHSERHLSVDPPSADELERLRADARAVYAEAVPQDVRDGVGGAVAVAGTATSCAAIAQDLDPYDPDRVHGYVLELATLETLLCRLAAMPEAERRTVRGLQPDRAPTIVAGVALLIEALRVFGLDRCEVSEHDILRGVTLRRAGLV
jgi:exopolyphosphatase/guanosine-5'-triphosphate,3'-diphosphate pyrophosphatase